MKAVLDTNVLIAAFLTEGVCYKILVRARKGDYEFIISDDILEEFENVLKKKFVFSNKEISEALLLLKEAAKTIIYNVKPVESACRDSDDDKILALSLEVKADFLVTGDKELLGMKKYGKTTIISPKEFEGFFVD